MPPAPDLLRLLRDIRHELDGDVSLGRLAARAGWSPFHLHRAFQRNVGETPKRYTRRLRLESAAARLVAERSACVAAAAQGEERVEAGVLHGGAVAVAMQPGSYEQLGETYAPLER